MRVELKLPGHLLAVEVLLPVHIMGQGVVLNPDAVGVGEAFALFVVEVVVVFVLDNFCSCHHVL